MSLRSIFASLCTALLLSTSVVAAPTQAPIANPTVIISAGTIVGTATVVSNLATPSAYVNAYLGVPYGAPPTGDLRFAAPTDAPRWSGNLAAQTIPPTCLQNFISGVDKEQEYFNNPMGVVPTESEDCLYLNVFAPQGASSTNLKPVLFWLFGGNLAFGSGSLDFYNGSSFAYNQDVVVVSINYRTNIFGFPGAAALPAGQTNVGFLDQRFAQQWVQKNIQQFGGDPSKVTLFGESAGGESIKQLLAQPPSPLPFRAAILESPNAVTSSSDATFKLVEAHFGCSDIECLRKVPGTDIQSYIASMGLGFGPVNDVTNTPDVRPMIRSKKFANVPTLIGSNAQEAQIFLALFGLGSGQQALSAVFDFLKLNGSSVVANNAISMLAAAGVTDLLDVADRIGTDAIFTCTVSSLSSFLALYGYNVWRYRYEGVFPNLALYPGIGATHTLEIPLVWGTYPLSNAFGDATADEVKLSEYMQGTWANFAKNPLSGVKWPKIGSNLGKELGVLGGSNNPGGETTLMLAYADALCPLLNPVSQLLGLAY